MCTTTQCLVLIDDVKANMGTPHVRLPSPCRQYFGSRDLFSSKRLWSSIGLLVILSMRALCVTFFRIAGITKQLP
eukprot:c36712_g1_i1 orf=282-506(+)